MLVGEHTARLTRSGRGGRATLLEQHGRRVEVIVATAPTGDRDDDFMAVLTSLAARRCGRRHAKRRAAQIQACVQRSVEQAEQVEEV